MAHNTNINVNGQSIPVTEFDHTAQEIDDSVKKTVTMVRPNLLDNWYFAGGGSQQGGGQFPINQRGQTSYSGTKYGIDRWKLSGSNVTLGLGNSGITVTSTNSATTYFVQPIENSYGFAGKTVTMSALTADHECFSGTGTAPTMNGGPSLIAFSGTDFTLRMYSKANGYLEFNVDIKPNKSFTIVAVKLEIGAGQTLAHQDEDGNWVLNEIPNFQEQLARCQRYAISLNPYKYGSRTVGSGISTSTTSCYVLCPTPVPVRTTPSITRSGSWRLVGSNTCTVSNITVNNFAGNGVKLLVTSSGLIDGETYFLESSANSSDILLSADL